MAKPKYINFKN